MAGNVKLNNLGLGAEHPGEVTPEDDIYEQYKKRMMLGYRYRPNPLVCLLFPCIIIIIPIRTRVSDYFYHSVYLSHPVCNISALIDKEVSCGAHIKWALHLQAVGLTLYYLIDVMLSMCYSGPLYFLLHLLMLISLNGLVHSSYFSFFFFCRTIQEKHIIESLQESIV